MCEQIYYHYLSSENAIKDLKDKRIKISTLDDLNDPFELRPYLRYRDPKKRRLYHNIRNKIGKKYGLLCFSNSYSKTLLWSHYADKHKGMALGFEITNYEILEVHYTSEPLRQKIELSNDPKKDEKKFLELAEIKYGEWHYEEEYRILVELEGRKDGNHYFLEFGDGLKVKKVVFGCNYGYSDIEEIEQIMKLARQLGLGAEDIIPTRYEWQGYKINPDGTRFKKFKLIYEELAKA